MPIMFEISVVKVGGSLRMTIPKEIADAMKIDKGDKLEVTMNNGEMVVKKRNQ